MSPRYATPAAFRTAVETRLKTAAISAGRPVNQLRRQYLTQRFLARVYAADRPEWILLGGSALLARIPGARHSQDIDFIHPHDLTAAVGALAELVAADPAPDPFRFDITPAAAPRDDDHLTLKVVVRLGASSIDSFTVDITRRFGVEALDTVQPEPVIVVDDVDDLPPFLTVPLAQQVADKLCAMYEIHRHGDLEVPSSRFRDLVDLIIIATNRGGTKLAADSVIAAVTAEQRRRAMAIPTDLPSPGRQWAAGYSRMATRFVPRNLNSLDPALDRLRAFAGPIVVGTATGTWKPTTRQWTTA